MEYIPLPFSLRNGYLTKADLRESLTFSVGLILSSRTGVMPFDPEFGCIIWEKEFTDLQTANKGDIRSALRNAIDKYEKRLYNVSVSFTNLDTNFISTLGIDVKVSGYYKEGDEEKKFEATYKLA
jgi:phage baseplate assembly protein W